MQVRGRGETVRPPPRDRLARESLVADVIAIEDSSLLDALVRRVGGQVDEASLRLEVVLPRRVVVEVVAADVGKRGDVEIARANAFLHQSVRSGLDHRGLR